VIRSKNNPAILFSNLPNNPSGFVDYHAPICPVLKTTRNFTLEALTNIRIYEQYMNTMHRYHSLFPGLSVILSGLVFLAKDAVADSITVSETWKDNAVAGVYASPQDTGTFKASLTVPGPVEFDGK